MDTIATRGAPHLWSEAARISWLAAAAAWLLHPFATSRLIGAGDAAWYVNTLADFVSQLRAGVFPVFVGQTDFSFNGSVYPLRVAPLYQHLAGLADLLTGRRLGFIALQHLVVIGCGVVGIYATYFALCDLAPRRRWSAAALAILYLSCPGVLGTIYTQDLYMTWMTVPFATLAAYGMARTFRSDNLASQAWFAGPLAALWWGHSPIALWMSLLGAVTQVIRLTMVHRSRDAWRRAVAGAGLFLVLAQYPFVSVATLHRPGTGSTVVATLAHADRIAQNVRQVFPADLLPLSKGAAALSDLQLGYGLGLVLLSCLLTAIVTPEWDLRSLMIGCLGLLLLLFPVPGVNAALWAHLPEELKRITYYWPMQRFYLILAAVLAVAGQMALSRENPPRRRVGGWWGAILILACSWALLESRQFTLAGRERTASAAATARVQRPENRLIMNHAYGLFLRLPAYFSNGVMAAWAETRLLDRTTLRALPEAEDPTGIVESGLFRGQADDNPSILKLTPTLRLAPGRRYRLELRFTQPGERGILQLTGRSLFREYILPSSGEPRAFGNATGNDPGLPLWTTDPKGDDITVRFIPESPADAPRTAVARFAVYRLREIDPHSETIHLESLVPFRVEVRAKSMCWLETPRMAMPGYQATVNGRPEKTDVSPEGLVMIPLQRGVAEVELRFVGPWLLRASYSAAWLTWAAFGIACAIGWLRTRQTQA